MRDRALLLVLLLFLGRAAVGSPLQPDSAPDSDAGVLKAEANYEISPLAGPQNAWGTPVVVTATGASLIVTVDALDPDPTQIQAAQSRTDALRSSDDAVRLFVDPAADGKRAFVFGVNASGARADAIESSSGRGSSSWSGNWESKVERHAAGYRVVFRIPFETLGISSTGRRQIRWNVTRKVGRGRTPTLSVAQIDPLKLCVECQYVDLAINADGQSRPNWKLTPYIAVASETGEANQTSTTRQVGLDAVWDNGRGQKVVATINPDFSEVALDGIQFTVNQRYALSQAERRTFFTNSAGLFSSQLRLLYTRNIVNPQVGVLIASQRKGFESAAFIADDSLLSIVEPDVESSQRLTYDVSSLSGAGRAAWTVSQSLSLGAFATFRNGGQGYRNAVVAGDWSLRSGSWTFDGQVAGSERRGLGLPPQRGVAGVFSLDYGKSPFMMGTTLEIYDRGFRADLGLENQVGVARFRHYDFYEWKRPGRVVDRLSMSYDFSYEATQGGAFLYLSHSASALAHLSSNTSLSVSASRQGDAEDGVTFYTGTVSTSVRQELGKRVTATAAYTRGQAVDYSVPQIAQSRSVSAGVGYRGGRRLTTSMTVVKNDLDSPGGTSYKTLSAELRLTGDITPHHHVLSSIVYGRSVVAAGGDVYTSSTAAWQLGYQFDLGAFRKLSLGMSERLTGTDTSLRGLEAVGRLAFLKFKYDFNY